MIGGQTSDDESREASFAVYTRPSPSLIPQLKVLSQQELFELDVVSRILPFRVSKYVVDELIDWAAAPHDPIYRLVFPTRSLIDAESFDRVATAITEGRPPAELRSIIRTVRASLNPHPADQLSLNRPTYEGEQISGLQHKYPETALFFPSDGQTCHSYCTFCFRWAQFVREDDWRIAMSDRDLLVNYLKEHREVTDLLVTGGDAFTIKARRLKFFLEPLVSAPELDHIRTVRFGTKALSFWPQRFISDPDSEELLDVLRWLTANGKHVAIMAHFNHWRELTTPIVTEAVRRLRETGAVIRTQGPLLRGINDSAEVWARMWQRQVELGMVPYYMFVARDTGPVGDFAVPLERAWRIYAEAQRSVSGIARTVRGPSMSASPGKIEILGISEVAGRRVFVLRMLQSRDPSLTHQPFFAEYDADAIWLDNLKPAFAARFPFDQASSSDPGIGSPELFDEAQIS